MLSPENCGNASGPGCSASSFASEGRPGTFSPWPISVVDCDVDLSRPALPRVSSSSKRRRAVNSGVVMVVDDGEESESL